MTTSAYVFCMREKQVLTLEQAVRKMTGLPARKLQLKDRGLLRKGYQADIVVFDPETITEMATFRDPCQISKGMKHVIVNGTFIIRDESLDTEAMPGRAVRASIVD